MATTVERLQAVVDADATKAAANLAALDAELDRVARNRRGTLVMDTDTSQVKQAEKDIAGLENASNGGSNGLNNLKSSSDSSGASLKMLGAIIPTLQFGAIYSGATMAGGALSSLGALAGAAMGVLGPLSGLLGTIPVGIGAVAGGIGVSVLGLSGIKQGYQALDQQMTATAKGSDQLAERQIALRNAHLGVRSAALAAAQAQQTLQTAQKAMKDAPAEAAQALVDQKNTVKQAILDEESAVLRLRDAQKQLKDAEDNTTSSGYTLTKQTDAFTGKIYEVATQNEDAAGSHESVAQAQLNVKQATLDVTKARENATQQEKLLTEMEKKGIKNSDIMVQARMALRQAELGVAQARASSINATQQQKEAQEQMNGTYGAAGSGAQAYAKTLGKLTPAGLAFVHFLHDDMAPEVKKLQRTAQEGLLPGVQSGLEDVLSLMKYLQPEVSLFARTVGTGVDDFFGSFSNPNEQRQIKSTMDGLATTLGLMLEAATPLSKILLDVTRYATPLTDHILESLVGDLKEISSWTGSATGKEDLSEWFAAAYKTGDELMGVLKPLTGILVGVSKAAEPLADWILKGIAKDFRSVNDEVNSTKGQKNLTDWFNANKPGISALGGLLKDLSKVLFSTPATKDSSFTKTLNELDTNVVPAIGRLMKGLDKSNFGVEFAELLGHVVDAIDELVRHDGALTTAVKMINNLADAFNWADKVTHGKSSNAIVKALEIYGGYKLAKVATGGDKGIVGSVGGAAGDTVKNIFTNGVTDVLKEAGLTKLSGVVGRDLGVTRVFVTNMPAGGILGGLGGAGKGAAEVGAGAAGVGEGAAVAGLSALALPIAVAAAGVVALAIVAPAKNLKDRNGNPVTVTGARNTGMENFANQGKGGFGAKQAENLQKYNKGLLDFGKIVHATVPTAKTFGDGVKNIDDQFATMSKTNPSEVMTDLGDISQTTGLTIAQILKFLPKTTKATKDYEDGVHQTSVKAEELNGNLDTMATRLKNIHGKTIGLNVDGNGMNAVKKFGGWWDHLSDKTINLNVKSENKKVDEFLNGGNSVVKTPPKPRHRSGGGDVSPDLGGYIVGEFGPEFFQPKSAGTIRHMSDVRGYGGYTDGQLERIVTKVMNAQKTPQAITVNTTNQADPQHVANAIAWRLR